MLERVYNGKPLWKTIWQFLWNLTYTNLWSSNSIIGINTRKMETYGHKMIWTTMFIETFVCNRSKLEITQMSIKNSIDRGFPGGAVVESLPADAGDAGSSPGLGGSHMPRSGWAREPQLLSLRVWSLCSETREVAIERGPRTAMKSGPRLPQLEKALAQRRRPNTAKK